MDNSTYDNDENLVSFLEGGLNDIERKAIEQQLSVDMALKQKYDSLVLTRESIRYYGLQQQVASVHQQMLQEMVAPVRKINSPGKIIRYTIAIAASLVLIAGSYMAYNFFTLSSDKVFASNYQAYELVTVRDLNTDETAIERAYREKKYKEVMRIHDAGEDLTIKGEYLCGTAALELKENVKAIDCFKKVLEENKKTGQSILNEEAEYYLSLTYIRTKEYDNALILLNKMHDDPGHLYNERITGKLLRQVKVLKRR
ncbi:MAG: hypothetical protein IPK90_15055 [Chitinophagaceae bacterium]|nr:hypothetical protein [Chitinophagaceae bacterium]